MTAVIMRLQCGYCGHWLNRGMRKRRMVLVRCIIMEGVAQDFKEAVKWYRLAAAQGYESAQVNRGAMYYEGQGIAEDFIRAYMWLSIAAAKGNANAVQLRDVVSKYIIDQQIVEAQAMAHKCEASSYKQCD